MGTSTSFDQVAAKLNRVAKVIDGTAKTNALHAIGKEGKRIISNVYERDMGGDLSLSHWRGSRVMVGYDFVGADAVAFKPRDSKGGAVLRVMEDNARAHRINRKGRGVRGKRGRGRKVLRIGGNFVGQSVLWQPRSGGKRTWRESGVVVHREQWARYFDREYAKELGKIF